MLNLILLCIAAIQAPIIMMSQRRQRPRIGCGRSTIIAST
nr:DUF1003 domain-containing protein [Nordella sp. HKS 07]